MQNGLPYLDILIFAIIAVFLVFRLKNILGTKTDSNDLQSKNQNNKGNSSNVINIDTKNQKVSDKKDIDVETKKIKDIDTTFDKKDFLSGSQIFFKMVLDGFINGDLDKVKDFIKPSVFKNFKLAIDERIKEKETLIIDIKSTNKIDILSSKVTKTSISINVVFETFQIKALKDKDDKIIDGDINEEILVKDVWVFEKKINNDNPNWTLVETKSL
jgi:predicted lipid-binding transport protein (Tim44 family)